MFSPLKCNTMKRFLKVACIFFIWFGLGTASILSAATSPKPNIVLILADDYGWGSVGCYGGKGLRTPNLDKLATQGRLFRNAYATGSVCSPTRYALMTGRYFWRTSVKDGKVLPGNGPLHIETNRMTLASLCKSQGYRTAIIGKWHLGIGMQEKTDWDKPLKPGPQAVGFDYFYGLGANIGNQPGYLLNNERVITNASDGAINLQKEPERVMSNLTAQAVSWIEMKDKTPFFLYFAPNGVHEPVTPRKDFESSKFGKYGDFIEELDWTVGEVLQALDRNNLSENTLVIFSSDNGGVAHPQNPKAGAAMKAGLAINGILRGGKHDIYEGGFREPYIVRWPGKVSAGTTCDEIVSLSDTLATLASILKTPIPSGNGEDSLDVSSAWLGISSKKPVRESIVLQDSLGNYAIRQGPWKLIERENPPKFVPRGAKGTRQAAKTAQLQDELYNLEKDPSESKNVAAEHPEIVNRLRQILTTTRDQGAKHKKVDPKL